MHLKSAWLAIELLALLPLATNASEPSNIAIDVGHFTQKPGAMSARGQTELSFNQALARVVASTLQSKGANIALIGINGDMSSLSGRTQAAKDANAHFFLSLHHDSAQQQYIQEWQWQGSPQHYSDRFSGFSLFISRKNPDIAHSLQCASAIGSALIQAGFHPSEHHAEHINGESKEWADKAHGVYYFDDLVVLKTATMPATLLESGVIINRDDEVTLSKPETQQAIANAVAVGLAECGMLHTK